MSPKYKTGSGRSKGASQIDAYLDDQDFRHKAKSRPKKQQPKPVALKPEEANGTIIEVFPNQCNVRFDDGTIALCSYRRAQVIYSEHGSTRERSPVAVGDRVRAQKLGVIDGVCSRRNFLARPAPGRDDPSLIHVVAANLDLLVIVASVDRPEFAVGLVDRYLIAAEAAGIETLLCVTKSDLLQEGAPHLWENYGELGYRWILISAKQKDHVEDLKKEVAGKTATFCGHSGVGKTSLFRVLTGRPDLGKIGDVNLQTGKGKHTTTSSVLYRDEASQSDWIDTPGIREFGLIGVTPETLQNYFPEFRGLSCTAAGCDHLEKAGCQAVGLFRYSSYQRIHASFLQPIS